MNFTSLLFIVFLIFTVAVNKAIPSGFRVPFLLGVSYLFFASQSGLLFFIMFGETLITYFAARIMQSFEKKSVKKAVTISAVILCFAVLFVFKYLDFVADGLGCLLTFFGLSSQFRALELVLPIGISFYTFQAVAYVIDVYRGEKCEKNFFKYALYIAFFPQLVAGPIERSKDLLPQFGGETYYEDFTVGFKYIAGGYIKKVIIADSLAVYVDKVYLNVSDANGIALIIATLFFAVQIYCDFSGYCDIAVGTARMLGVRLTDNFDRPYMSTGIREFWRRWHISLGRWFTDYLYIPLGGNRNGRFRTCLNILIVFALSGLWHGADITFLLWGLCHGIALVIETLFFLPRRKETESKKNRILQWLSRLAVCLFVCVTWVFFRSENLSQCIAVFGKIFGDYGGGFKSAITMLGMSAADFLLIGGALALLTVLPKPSENRAVDSLFGDCAAKSTYLYALSATAVIICLLVVMGRSGGNGFIYFRF